jgi:hypothetical protein
VCVVRREGGGGGPPARDCCIFLLWSHPRRESKIDQDGPGRIYFLPLHPPCQHHIGGSNIQMEVAQLVQVRQPPGHVPHNLSHVAQAQALLPVDKTLLENCLRSCLCFVKEVGVNYASVPLPFQVVCASHCVWKSTSGMYQGHHWKTTHPSPFG